METASLQYTMRQLHLKPSREVTRMPNTKPMSTINDLATLQREIAELIISAVNLDIAADDVNPDAPLFGEGLGLDSIDVLEVALVVSKRYGMQLRSDSADNVSIFSSLRNLSQYIAEHRTK